MDTNINPAVPDSTTPEMTLNDAMAVYTPTPPVPADTPVDATPAEVAAATTVGQVVAVRCNICGKPLTDPDSIAEGIGPSCKARGWTKEKMAEVLGTRTVTAIPEGWIAAPLVYAKAREMDIAAGGLSNTFLNRLVSAVGGDRCASEPWLPIFAYSYVGTRKYFPPEIMTDGMALLADETFVSEHIVKKAKTPKSPKEPRVRKSKTGADEMAKLTPADSPLHGDAASIAAQALKGGKGKRTLRPQPTNAPDVAASAPLIWGEPEADVPGQA